MAGEPVPRPSDPPRPLWIAILRGEHDHARILGIDASGARGLRGVRTVIRAEDLASTWGAVPVEVPELADLKLPPAGILARDEVCFRGEPIAAVAAETREAAEDALERIEVRYEVLPAVRDPAAALSPECVRARAGAPDNLGFRWRLAAGDVEAGFSRADRILSRRFSFPRTPLGAPGSRASTAWEDPAGGLAIVSGSTRAPHLLRTHIARGLSVPDSSVRVLCGDAEERPVPGLAGLPEDCLVAALARKLAPRPVRWVESRRERALLGPHIAAVTADVSVGARKDGKLVAIRCEAIVEAGACLLPAWRFSPAGAAALLVGPYGFSAASLSLSGAITNGPPTDLLALGGPVAFGRMLEEMVDLLAAELELDPLELRRINTAPAEESRVSIAGVRFEPDRCRAVLEALAESSGARSLRSSVEARRARGEVVGLGVSLPLEVCVRAAARKSGPEEWEAATVRVLPSGAAEVAIGAVPEDGRLGRALARIASGALGVPLEDVAVRWGDTAAVPPGCGGLAGHCLPVCGAAVARAARAVEARMRSVAAALLRAPEEYVQREGDDFVAGDRAVSRKEVCRQAYRAGALPRTLAPGLEATSFEDPDEPRVSIGAHLSVVSVDPETGRVRVERHVAVHDVGAVLDPESAEASARDGVARGAGLVLAERILTLDDDALPLRIEPLEAVLLPSDLGEVRCSFVEPRGLGARFASRGLGRVSATGAAAAVASATLDALRPLGVRRVATPATPEAVWRAMRAASGSSSSDLPALGRRPAERSAGATDDLEAGGDPRGPGAAGSAGGGPP